MKSIRFIDVWLNADTDEFHVESTVDKLSKQDTQCILGGYTDAFVDACSSMTSEQVRALQTILLSFAAGVAAASGNAQENIDYFSMLVSKRAR